VVIPSQHLPDSEIPIVFNKTDTEFMIKLGEKDAADVISKGSGTEFERIFGEAKTYRQDRVSNYL